MKRSIFNVMIFFFVGLSLAVVMIPAKAQALPLLIDFGSGNAGVGGTVTLLPGPNATGEGIPVDALTVAGTASMDGVYDTSGAFSISNPPAGDDGTAAVLSFDTRNGSNFISIVGGVPSLSLNDGTLLLGKFSSFSISQQGSVLSISGGGLDTKCEDLLDALGIDPKTQWGFFGFSLSVQDTGGTFTGTSTDIINTAVPEPSLLLLLGSGLLGVLALRRK